MLFPNREFGRWKVSNLAVERRDFLESQLPLTPEFIRNIRLLGRRPTTQMITDNLIRKYGTHFLLSATLGGKPQQKAPSLCVIWQIWKTNVHIGLFPEMMQTIKPLNSNYAEFTLP